MLYSLTSHISDSTILNSILRMYGKLIERRKDHCVQRDALDVFRKKGKFVFRLWLLVIYRYGVSEMKLTFTSALSHLCDWFVSQLEAVTFVSAATRFTNVASVSWSSDSAAESFKIGSCSETTLKTEDDTLKDRIFTNWVQSLQEARWYV